MNALGLDPVFSHQGIDKGHQLCRAFMSLGHMSLHRSDWGATEETYEGIVLHMRTPRLGWALIIIALTRGVTQ